MRTVSTLFGLALLLLATNASNDRSLAGNGLTPFLDDVFDITRFKAVGDGVTLNTEPIQAAIQAAATYFRKTGRIGFVRVPPTGVYLSGTVILRSGVYLDVQGVLKASSNIRDFPLQATCGKWPFLYANGESDIGVVGGGTVDGSFEKWIAGFDAKQNRFLHLGWDVRNKSSDGFPQLMPNPDDESRPRIAIFESSVGVVVRNVTFTGSPDWSLHLLNCSSVHVKDWTLRGDERWPNNDGLDIDACEDVLVEDSDIDTADDGICIKGDGRYDRVNNITVRNVRIRSRSSAIKFGSDLPIPVSNILFEDILIHDSNRGIALQTRDGGTISNVTFRNIVINGTRLWPTSWWGDGSALYISSMKRNANDSGCEVRNVTFENIWAVSQTGSVFSGLAPGKKLKDVKLVNVTLNIDRYPRWNYSTSNGVTPSIEYEPTVVTRARVSDSGWMSGIYAENVEGLVLDRVAVIFNNRRHQSYWGTSCLNFTAAGFPVGQHSVTCVPPEKLEPCDAQSAPYYDQTCAEAHGEGYCCDPARLDVEGQCGGYPNVKSCYYKCESKGWDAKSSKCTA